MTIGAARDGAQSSDQYRKDHVDPLTSPVRLGVPADPRSIPVVRAVVASVSSKLDIPYDTVDDLRIAAAEASTLLITSGAGSSQLSVELRPGATDLRMVLWIEGMAPSDLDEDRQSLPWRVIEGLTDDARVTQSDGHPAIELRVRTVPR